MTDALLADLRALAEVMTCEWTNGATCEETCCINGQIKHLIAKREAEPDVSERDELARVIARELGCIRKGEIGGHSMCGEHHYGWLSTGECPVQERITDAILAAGWRRR